MMLAAPSLRLTPLTTMPGAEVESVFGTSAELWAIGLIFIRLASLVMLMPGIGDQAVPPRYRLGLAFVLALVVAPIVRHTLPPMPLTIGGMTGQVMHEAIIGLMLGTLMRVLMYSLATTGEIMSLQTTLSFAQTANPAQAQPSTSIGTFMAMLGLILIYATNLHHLFIRAMVDSFTVFPATKPVMVGDAVTLMVQTVTRSFLLAMQMAAPLIAFALIFNVAVGFVGRMMPNFPIFFAATPLNVLFGLALLALSLGSIGMLFIEHYQDFLAIFLRKTNG